jgi:hypothetical protein
MLRHTFPRNPLPHLRCLYQRSLQRVSLTFPWNTGLVKNAADEHGHRVRQCIMMELVVFLRLLDEAEVDESGGRVLSRQFGRFRPTRPCEESI